MTSRKDLGDFGERVAKAHLEANGYRILETNFRVREGEVDIVAERDGVVAFVPFRPSADLLQRSRSEDSSDSWVAHF